MSHPSANDALVPLVPDRHGETALLLVESLIHALIARSGLTLGEAIEVVETAIDAQTATSEERGDPESHRIGVKYLTAVVASLRIDDLRNEVGRAQGGDEVSD